MKSAKRAHTRNTWSGTSARLVSLGGLPRAAEDSGADEVVRSFELAVCVTTAGGVLSAATTASVTICDSLSALTGPSKAAHCISSGHAFSGSEGPAAAMLFKAAARKILESGA